MSIQVGDRVVRIEGNCGGHVAGPTETVVGRVYTVTRVVSPDEYRGPCVGGLVLAEVPCDGLGYCRLGFRKVQKADDGFIQHMRMMRPKTPSRQREDA